jgi:simple sugar transport system permease protein
MDDLLFATLRLATPLIFAALGGLLSERSGVVNIALEGFILFGAFAAATATHFSGSPGLGWMTAFAAGALMAALYAFAVIEGRSDQIVAGTAFNLFAIGFIPFLSKVIFDGTGSTPSLPIDARLSYEPLAIALLTVVAVVFLFKKTRAGLWISFAGEHPKALSSAGVSVRKVRWAALIVGGGLAGWGGATLSLALASSYSPLMSSGRGFIALAALIFGKWKPLPTVIACLFFGFADALQIRLQGVRIWGTDVPVEFIQILPYVLTLIVLAGLIGRSQAPRGLGKDLDGRDYA